MSACKSRVALSYSFILARVHNQPIKALSMHEREEQTRLKCYWTQNAPLTRIPLILVLTIQCVNKLDQTCLLSLSGRCFHLPSLDRSRSSAYWQSVSVPYAIGSNSVLRFQIAVGLRSYHYSI